MRHTLINSILVSFLILISSNCCHAVEEDKITIGVILALSGEGASWGEAFRNGLSLAQDKISPEIKKRIRYVFEDDAMLAKNSLSALNKLSANYKLDAVVSLSSGTSKALAPVTEQKQITFLAIASDTRISAGRKNAFNFWVTPDEEIRVALPQMKKMGFRKVARISTIHEGVFALRDSMDLHAGTDVEIMLDEEYPTDIKDFRTSIAKIRNLKACDVIMPLLLPGQIGIFAKQVRESGIKTPFFTFETVEDIKEIKASNGALVGTVFVNAGNPDLGFIENYRHKFPDSSTYVSASGYDLALLLAKAVAEGKGHALSAFFSTFKNFSGAQGTYSALGNGLFSLPAEVKEVTPDGFRSLQE